MLTIGVKADDAVFHQEFRGIVEGVEVLCLEAAQETVATNGDQRRADALLDVGEALLQVGQYRLRRHGGEHDAVADGAVEGEAEVVVNPLDGAHVVVVAEFDRERVQGKVLGGEFGDRLADEASIGLGGGFGIQLKNRACGGVGLGDDEFLRQRLHVVGGEHFERQGSVKQHHDGSRGVKGALGVNMGVGEVDVVASGAAKVRNAAEGGIEGKQYLFFFTGQAVDKGECEKVALCGQVALGFGVKDKLVEVLLGLWQGVVVECFYQAGADGEADAAEADGTDTVLTVALGSEFAGGGAAGEFDIREAMAQCFG